MNGMLLFFAEERCIVFGDSRVDGRGSFEIDALMREREERGKERKKEAGEK